jgi:hypothetical protein
MHAYARAGGQGRGGEGAWAAGQWAGPEIASCGPPAVKSMRTTLTARMQLVASQLQIGRTIRGLLKVYASRLGRCTVTVSRPACSSCWKWLTCRDCPQPSSRRRGFGRACARYGRHWIEPCPAVSARFAHHRFDRPAGERGKLPHDDTATQSIMKSGHPYS